MFHQETGLDDADDEDDGDGEFLSIFFLPLPPGLHVLVLPSLSEIRGMSCWEGVLDL